MGARAGDAGLTDYDTHNDILTKVGQLGIAWLSEVHGKVREVVDGELRTRIAKYVTLVAPEISRGAAAREMEITKRRKPKP